MGEPVAFAIGAHPDDIELMMAGTLLALGEAGYRLHVMNVANGSCGSMTEDAGTIAARRTDEARAAAHVLGAQFHPPITDDLEIFYSEKLLRRMAAVVREVEPAILLLHSPRDYMEDHVNACRLGVTAAFSRGMPNFQTDPSVAPTDQAVTLYHAMPWGLRGPLEEIIEPNRYVDITAVMETKRAALACHASQRDWLDTTQGLGSYLDTMEAMARTVGELSGRFQFAEGWRRHLHLGFCGAEADPLMEALGSRAYCVSAETMD